MWISALVFLAAFVAQVSVEILFCRFIVAVQERDAIRAATLSSMGWLLNALCIVAAITYDLRLIVVLTAGVFVGTFLAIGADR